MKTTILVTTYNRPKHLEHCLKSLEVQWPRSMDCEVLVLNDGEPNDGTLDVVSKQTFPIRYLFTGENKKYPWRTMGFPANIGIQNTDADIVVLSNCDIYHLGTTIAPVIRTCAEDEMALGTVGEIYDDDGTLLNYLNDGGQIDSEKHDAIVGRLKRNTQIAYDACSPFVANTEAPFFMAIRRSHLIDIGGYDEDMVGVAADDNDLIERLLGIGCHFVRSSAKTIHLFHPNDGGKGDKTNPRYVSNVAMWKQRRGITVRNIGRKWGVL